MLFGNKALTLPLISVYEMKMGERVLITGGCGFVGSHLVDEYLRSGYEVRVLDNLDPVVHGALDAPPSYVSKDIEFIRGDIRDTDLLTKCLKGVSVVSHQAAAVSVMQSMWNPTKYAEVNTLGTAKLLELLVDRVRFPIRKLIIPSSMSIYGEGLYKQNGHDVCPDLRSKAQLENGDWELQWNGSPCEHAPTNEEKPLRPTSVYAITKRDQEEMGLSIGREYEIPVVALRYFNIYGPRQSLSNPYTGVAAIFSSRMLNGNPPVVFEDGNQLRDFVHVSDVAQANLLASHKSDGDYQVFNIGSGKPISILDVAEKIIREFGKDIRPKITNSARPGDIRHCYADISKATEMLGYQPKADFDESIHELIDWVSRQSAPDNFESAYKQFGV